MQRNLKLNTATNNAAIIKELPTPSPHLWNKPSPLFNWLDTESVLLYLGPVSLV